MAKTKYRCQNCEAKWTEDQLKEIKDIEQRVSPGEPMPAGECPTCGSLCHEAASRRKREKPVPVVGMPVDTLTSGEAARMQAVLKQVFPQIDIPDPVVEDDESNEMNGGDTVDALCQLFEQLGELAKPQRDSWKPRKKK